MLRSLLICLVIVFSNPGWAFDRSTVEYVQQSLAELGYDPGPIDGAWGGKTRGALNELRGENGLPDAQDLVGSSVMLLHEIHPTVRTLPFPGQLQTNAAARRAYLTANPVIAAPHCGNGWGLPRLVTLQPPVTSLTADLVPEGKLSAAHDWYSDIGTRFTVTAAECQSGGDSACAKLVDNIYPWAQADALQSETRPSSSRFDGVQWVAGSLLRPMLSSYATARQLIDVPADVDAQIVDWLVDRAEFYYLPQRRTPREFVNQDTATNHQVSSALLYAMAGALIGDRVIFERGLTQWDEAIGSLRDDGSFPAETQRGAWSLSYTGLQMNYMVGLAELARHQNIVLDPTDAEAPDIHDAVRYYLGAMSDYGLIVDYASRNLASNDDNPRVPLTTAFEQMLGWLPYYLSAHDTEEGRALFADRELDHMICSDQQISEGKATRWRCRELAGQATAITLHQMLENAMLGHYNAGHVGACTHADRIDLFDLDAEVVAYSHLDWSPAAYRAAWVPTEPARVLFASEILLNHNRQDTTRFNVLLASEKIDGDGAGETFQFNLVGRATYDGSPDISAMKIIINEPISASVVGALRECGTNVGIEIWNGEFRPSITALRDGNTYSFENADCVRAGLPGDYSMRLEYFFPNFSEFVADFVSTGEADRLDNDLIEEWMRAVASGERDVVAR